jgi:hypothetical protein
MVCLVSASILLFEAGLVTLLLSTQLHGPMPQAVAALMLAPLLAMGKPLGVLIGGLLSVRSDRDSLSAISQP